MPAPPVRRKIRRLGALVGVWAILNGFAAFVLLHSRFGPSSDPGPGVAAASPSSLLPVFLLGLLVAALVSFVAEYLHDRIKEGEDAPPVTPARVLVLMLLLVMFELFASAGQQVVDYFGQAHHENRDVLTEIQTSVAPGTTANEAASPGVSPLVELGLLGALWAVVAAMVGLRLMRIVLAGLPGDLRSVGRGIREGLVAGVIVAPLVVIAYLLAVRLVVHLWKIGLSGGRPGALTALAVLAALAAAGWAWRHGRVRIATVLLAAVLVYELVTLGQEIDRVWTVAILAALVWGVPGLVLGALAPLLRARAAAPKLWGMLAAGTALLLVGLTWSRLTNPVFYWVAIGVALIGLFFLLNPRAPLRDYWPLLAIAMAAMVSSLMFVAQYATFMGILVQFHAINAVPGLRPHPIDEVRTTIRKIALWPGTDPDPEIREMLARARDLSQLSRDRLLGRLPEIQQALALLDAHLRRATAAYYRDGRLRGIIGPRAEVEQIYRELADAVEMAEDHAPRIEKLLARANEMLGREEARRSRDPSAGSAIHEQLRALQEPEDHGADVRRLEGELWRFAQLPSGTRGDDGPRLLARLDALLGAAGYRVGGPNLPLPPPGPFTSPDVRRTVRLVALRDQLLMEMSAPGTGRFTRPPSRAEGAGTSPAPRPPSGGAPDPLEEFTMVRATVARELRISRGQAPPAAPISVGPLDVGAQVMFPMAPRLARLETARAQLARAREQVETLHEWLTGSTARRLELALVGAFGFWMTVGLLVAWRLAVPPDPAERV